VQIVVYRGAPTGEAVTPNLTRLLCHAVLEGLPDPALPEAVESLVDVWRYHQPALPSPSALPTRDRLVGGRIGVDRSPDPILIPEG